MEILNYVNQVKSQYPTVDVNYVQFNRTTNEFGRGEIDLESKRVTVEVQTVKLSAFVNPETTKTLLEVYNVDPIEQLKHMLRTELEFVVEKTIKREMFDAGEGRAFLRLSRTEKLINRLTKRKPVQVIQGTDLEKSQKLISTILRQVGYLRSSIRLTPKAFIIVSAKTAALIYDSPMTRITPFENPGSNSLTYKTAELPCNIDVLIDPVMSWSDPRILVGLESDNMGGIMYIRMGEFDEIFAKHTVTPSKSSPELKITIEPKFNVFRFCDNRYVTVPIEFKDSTRWYRIKQAFSKIWNG